MKIKLADIRNSRIPTILGVCSDDARLIQWANEADERLLNCGRWWGTVAKYTLTVTDGTITWPREAAHIEAIKLCNHPISARNMWYEFREFVDPWCQDCTTECDDPRLEDRGMFPTIATIGTTGRMVRAYSLNAVDDDKRILVQGKDENGLVIRTDDSGTMVYGEWIELDTAGEISLNYFSEITGIQKDDTDYDILLYEYNPTTLLDEDLLGRYQPNENNPEYRRSYIRGIDNGCCGDDYEVEALVTRQHVPVAVDTDWLTLPNLAAYKFAMLACKFEEEGKQEEAEIEFKKAIRELKRQHQKMTGDRTTIVVSGHGTAHPDRIFRGFM